MSWKLSDDYEHLSDEIEYIIENILQESDNSEEYKELEKTFHLKLTNNCNCHSKCDDDDCIHGGNYELKNEQIILRDDRRCKDLIYECNDSCLCCNCLNKSVQFGPCMHLKIKNFEDKGLGLISEKYLPKGSFICEYAGEILTKAEAIKRDENNLRDHKMNYIFCLNEICMEKLGGKSIQTFIDPSLKGNIGRYINHSCEPNCEIISVRVDSIIPKIAIFTKRDIQRDEEITFSYGEIASNESDKKFCFCKSENCKFYLPNLSFC